MERRSEGRILRWGCDWDNVERLAKLPMEELESRVWTEDDRFDFHSEEIQRLAKLPKAELEEMIRQDRIQAEIDTPRLLREQDELWEAIHLKCKRDREKHNSH